MDLNLSKTKVLSYYFIWILIWLSIGVDPEIFINIIFKLRNGEKVYLSEISNFIRITSPIIISFFIIIFNYGNIKNIFYKYFFKNITFSLLNIFLIIKLIANLYTNNPNINIFWVYIAWISIFVIALIDDKNPNNLKYAKYISLIILFLVFLRFSYPLATNFFLSSTSIYNLWPKVYSFDFGAPRPTGLSRTALLIYCFLLVGFYNSNNYYKSRLFLLIFLGGWIIFLQSRTIVFLFFFLNVLAFYLNNSFNLKLIVKNICLLFLLPVLLFYGANSLKIQLLENKNYIKWLSEIKHDHSEKEIKRRQLFIKEELRKGGKVKDVQIFRDVDPRSFTSFRTLHWKEIIKKVKSSPFIGYGAKGDRFLIDQSASNLYFYALSSSGYIGLIIILILSIRYVYLVIYLLFYEKIFKDKKKILISSSSFIIILLFLRGILETSFGIFSIDYCIFIICALIIENEYNYLRKKI